MASAVQLASLPVGVLFQQQATGASMVSGRPVQIYLRGTTTPVQVYTDATLSTPLVTLGQPISTGSNGAAPGAIPGYIAAEQAIDILDVNLNVRYPAEPHLVAGWVAAPSPTGTASVDTAAILACLATSGKVRLAPGTYKITPGLVTLTSNTELEGAGRGITILQAAANSSDNPILQNADIVNGNTQIAVRNLTLDGNKANQSGDNGKHGIWFQRVGNSVLSNVECKNVDGHGIRIDGQGVVTRVWHLSDVVTHDNSQIGLYMTFSMRNIEYSNITAFNNGSHGVELDHSEAKATNIDSYGNTGRGIFIRNVFGCVYNNLHASLNQQDGIYVQGLVDSVGANWYAASNSQAGLNLYNEITFSGDNTLSYGITNNAVISNIWAGHRIDFGTNLAQYAIYVGDPTSGNFGDLKLFNVYPEAANTGTYRTPASAGGLVIWDWPSSTSNMRFWLGTGLATPNGFQLGTSSGHKIGFLGATAVVQQTGGVKTAAATYGSNEQTMLQTIYNMGRTFGFLS